MEPETEARARRRLGVELGWAGKLASTVVLVTSPSRCARRMPRLTPGVRPKSSALTIETAHA